MQRFPIRHLMAIVAIVGLAMTKAVMVQRSNDYRALARAHADAERLSVEYANQIRGLTGTGRLEARYELMSAYHRALKSSTSLPPVVPGSSSSRTRRSRMRLRRCAMSYKETPR